MLQRVKDIRYQEIKNWKPIVSLRESYQKQSAGTFVFAMIACFVFCVFGYVIYLALPQSETPDPTAQASGDENSSLPILDHSTQKNAQNDAKKADDTPGSNLDSHSPSGLSSTKNSADQRSFGESTVSQPVQPSNFEREIPSAKQIASKKPQLPTEAGSFPRIGVINVETLVGQRRDAYVKSRIEFYQNQLQQKKNEFYRLALTNNAEETKNLSTRLFNLERDLTVFRIKEEAERFVETELQSYSKVIEQVAKNNHLDVVLRADKVVSFGVSQNITNQVIQELNRMNGGATANRVDYQSRSRF